MSFSITSSQASPNQPFFSPCIPKTPVEINKVNQTHPEDKIYEFLIDQKIIDESLNIQSEYLGLISKEISVEAKTKLDQLLNDEIQIVSDDKNYSLSFSIKELFTFLQIDKFEIVGGTVYSFLGKDLVRNVIDVLKIPNRLISDEMLQSFEKPANDVDIRVFTENPFHFEKKMIQFIHQKLTKDPLKLKRTKNQFHELAKERLIKKNLPVNEIKLKSYASWLYQSYIKRHIFTRFLNSKSLKTKELWSQISFEGATKFDLSFTGNRERSHLFTHNDLQIEISSLKNNFETYKYQSICYPTETVILHRLLKVVNAFKPQTINSRGACMLFSYLTKGWRYFSKDLEDCLIHTLNETHKPLDFIKTLKNHFPKSPTAPSVFFFNLSQALIKYDVKKIQEQVKYLLPMRESKDNKGNLVYDSFQKGLETLRNRDLTPALFHQKFQMIQSFYQIFVKLSHAFGCSHESFKIHLRTLVDKSHFELEFKNNETFSIIFENDLKTIPKVFNEAFKRDELVHHLKTLEILSRSIPDLLKSPQIDKLESLESDESLKELGMEWISTDHPPLKTLGFYLILFENFKEKTLKDFSLLLSHFIEQLMEPDSTRLIKNQIISLFCHYLKILSILPIEDEKKFKNNLKKILLNSKVIHDELKQLMALELLSLSNENISAGIYKIWKKDKTLLDKLNTFKFSLDFHSKSPEIALKIFKAGLDLEDHVEIEAVLICSKILSSFDTNLYRFNIDIKNDTYTNIVIELFKKLEPSKYQLKQKELKPFLEALDYLLNNKIDLGILLLDILQEKKLIQKGFRIISNIYNNLNKKILQLSKIFTHHQQNGSLSEELLLEFYTELSHLNPNELEKETFDLWIKMFENLLNEFPNLNRTLKFDSKTILLKNYESVFENLLKLKSIISDVTFRNLNELAAKIEFTNYTSETVYLKFISILEESIHTIRDVEVLKNIHEKLKKSNFSSDSQESIDRSNKIREEVSSKILLKILKETTIESESSHLIATLAYELIDKKEFWNDSVREETIDTLLKIAEHFVLIHKFSLTENLLKKIETQFETSNIRSSIKNIYKYQLASYRKEEEIQRTQFLINQIKYFEEDVEIQKEISIWVIEKLQSNDKIDQNILLKILDLILTYRISELDLSLFEPHLRSKNNDNLVEMYFTKLSTFYSLKDRFFLLRNLKNFSVELTLSIQPNLSEIISFIDMKEKPNFLYQFTKDLFNAKSKMSEENLYFSLSSIFDLFKKENILEKNLEKELFLKYLECCSDSDDLSLNKLGWEILYKISKDTLSDDDFNFIIPFLIQRVDILDKNKTFFNASGRIFFDTIQILSSKISKNALKIYLTHYLENKEYRSGCPMFVSNTFTTQVIKNSLWDHKSNVLDQKLKCLIEELTYKAINQLSRFNLEELISPKLFNETERLLFRKQVFKNLIKKFPLNYNTTIDTSILIVNTYIEITRNPIFDKDVITKYFNSILEHLFKILKCYNNESCFFEKLNEFGKEILSITGPINFLGGHHVHKLPSPYNYLSFIPNNIPKMHKKNAEFISTKKNELLKVLNFINIKWIQYILNETTDPLVLKTKEIPLQNFDYQLALYHGLAKDLQKFNQNTILIESSKTEILRSIYDYSYAISKLPLSDFARIYREIKISTLKAVISDYQLINKLETEEQVKIVFKLFSMYHVNHKIFSSIKEETRALWIIESLKESWQETSLNSTAFIYHLLKRYKNEAFMQSKKSQLLLSLIENQIRDKTIKNFLSIVEKDPFKYLEEMIKPYKEIIDQKN